jgi:hypothetical protein
MLSGVIPMFKVLFLKLAEEHTKKNQTARKRFAFSNLQHRVLILSCPKKGSPLNTKVGTPQ